MYINFYHYEILCNLNVIFYVVIIILNTSGYIYLLDYIYLPHFYMEYEYEGIESTLFAVETPSTNTEGKDSALTNLVEDGKQTDTGDCGSKTQTSDNSKGSSSKRPHSDSNSDPNFKKSYPISKKPRIELPPVKQHVERDLTPNCRHGDQEVPHQGRISGVGHCGCTVKCGGKGVLESPASAITNPLANAEQRAIINNTPCCVCNYRGSNSMCCNCNCTFCLGCVSGNPG